MKQTSTLKLRVVFTCADLKSSAEDAVGRYFKSVLSEDLNNPPTGSYWDSKLCLKLEVERI